MAARIAAMPPLTSHAPRPYSLPSRTSGSNGAMVMPSTGTVSWCASSITGRPAPGHESSATRLSRPGATACRRHRAPIDARSCSSHAVRRVLADGRSLDAPTHGVDASDAHEVPGDLRARGSWRDDSGPGAVLSNGRRLRGTMGAMRTRYGRRSFVVLLVWIVLAGRLPARRACSSPGCCRCPRGCRSFRFGVVAFGALALGRLLSLTVTRVLVLRRSPWSRAGMIGRVLGLVTWIAVALIGAWALGASPASARCSRCSAAW